MIVLKNIEMTLDTASIARAIRAVEDFREKLGKAMAELIRQLTEKGVEIAKAELIFFDDPAYYTGELSGSIRGETDNDGTGYVSTDCEYAIYVEYGTGWGFDDGNTDGVGRIGKPMHSMSGWYYFNDNDGKFHFTEGMFPRPFMHNTLHDLETEAEAIGGKVIAEYIQ